VAVGAGGVAGAHPVNIMERKINQQIANRCNFMVSPKRRSGKIRVGIKHTPVFSDRGAALDYGNPVVMSAPPSSESGVNAVRRATWLTASGAVYSCVTAPDFHRLRL
jgi:hypothetical protein